MLLDALVAQLHHRFQHEKRARVCLWFDEKRDFERLLPPLQERLASMAEPLWEAADALPVAGRVLYATCRDWPRPDDPLLSAWLAINCIREWRGDTHFAILTAEDIGQIEAGILHGAWMNYADDWLPRSRGADDAGLAAAFAELERRGLATNGAVS